MKTATDTQLASQQRLLDAVRRWPSPEARTWSFAALERVTTDPGVQAVIAVGSAIRDIASSTDIDLVIIYEGQKPRLGIRPIDADIKLYERGQVECQLAAGNDYLVWALRFGLPVFRRNRYWDSLVAEWGDKAPLPDPCQSDARAATAERYYHDLLAAGDDDAAREQYLSMLTHRARAALLRAGILGASRPELAHQLERVGGCELAAELREAVAARGR